MLTVVRVDSIYHLFHGTRPDRRATFVRVGAGVRYTFRGANGRHQTMLTVEAARRRWTYLRKIGYLRWEELPVRRQQEVRT